MSDQLHKKIRAAVLGLPVSVLMDMLIQMEMGKAESDDERTDRILFRSCTENVRILGEYLFEEFKTRVLRAENRVPEGLLTEDEILDRAWDTYGADWLQAKVG